MTSIEATVPTGDTTAAGVSFARPSFESHATLSVLTANVGRQPKYTTQRRWRSTQNCSTTKETVLDCVKIATALGPGEVSKKNFGEGCFFPKTPAQRRGKRGDRGAQRKEKEGEKEFRGPGMRPGGEISGARGALTVANHARHDREMKFSCLLRFFDPSVARNLWKIAIMAGRKPKPTALKKLEGNPGKRKLNTAEPEPASGRPAMPYYLTPRAKKEWKRIIPLLEEMGVLRITHGAALASYCMAFARWLEAEKQITARGIVVEEPVLGRVGTTDDLTVIAIRLKKNPACTAAMAYQKEMRLTLGLFGLDPSSVSRLHVDGKEEQESPLMQLMKSRAQARLNPSVQ